MQWFVENTSSVVNILFTSSKPNYSTVMCVQLSSITSLSIFILLWKKVRMENCQIYSRSDRSSKWDNCNCNRCSQHGFNVNTFFIFPIRIRMRTLTLICKMKFWKKKVFCFDRYLFLAIDDNPPETPRAFFLPTKFELRPVFFHPRTDCATNSQFFTEQLSCTTFHTINFHF